MSNCWPLIVHALIATSSTVIGYKIGKGMGHNDLQRLLKGHEERIQYLLSKQAGDAMRLYSTSGRATRSENEYLLSKQAGEENMLKESPLVDYGRSAFPACFESECINKVNSHRSKS